MGIKKLKLRSVCAALFVALMVIVEQSSAGILNKMTSMFSNKIELRVSVVDELLQPIPHTTLWFMYAFKDASERSVHDMERLLNRYAADYDLILPGTAKPISPVLVYYTDAKGGYQEVLEENNFRGLAELPVIVGALKRGYRARAYAKSIPVGSTHEIVIQLQRDESAVFDPRLLRLDEIRGLANNVSLVSEMEERAAYFDGLSERLVRLAQTFETEGKKNLAAISHYNVANLPSIDRVVGYDGKTQFAGYTRGYDEKSPVRKVHMDKALRIGWDVPLLRCDAVTKKFFEQKGGLWADTSKTSMRRQFIEDIEACVKSANGRVFPSTLLVLSQAYSYVGEHLMACDALQRAYRFEPRSFTAKEWPALFEGVERRARTQNRNFSAIPEFVCEIPKP